MTVAEELRAINKSINSIELRLNDIRQSGGGGGGAPVNAQYVVMALDGTLTHERVLTAGTGIGIVDGGAGGNVTVSFSHLGLEGLANPGADRIFFWDNGAGASAWLRATEGMQISGTDLKLDINGLAVLSPADPTADYVAVYDLSAGLHKKVLINTTFVTAGAAITDNYVARGDGGTRGIQQGAMTIEDDGDIWIVTSGAKLEWTNTWGADCGILFEDGGAVTRYGILWTSAGIMAICNRMANGTVEIRANTAASGAAGEVTVAYIEDTGVGILGAVEAAIALKIYGQNMKIYNSAANGIAQFQLENDARRFSIGVTGGAFAGTDVWQVYDNTAAARRFVINASGYIGIGAGNPSSPIDIDTFATQALEVIDAGTAGATESHWIEVKVGGAAAAYIRVYAAK